MLTYWAEAAMTLGQHQAVNIVIWCCQCYYLAIGFHAKMSDKRGIWYGLAHISETLRKSLRWPELLMCCYKYRSLTGPIVLGHDWPLAILSTTIRKQKVGFADLGEVREARRRKELM